MKDRDLMVPIQDYLKPETTLREAVNLLRVARRGEERQGVAKGKPFMIMAIFSVVTAILSAFLDNVTTVLLIAPVTKTPTAFWRKRNGRRSSSSWVCLSLSEVW